MNEESKRNSTSVLKMAQGAIIAAMYVVLTFVFAPVSFGYMQIRISEILTILPLFTPAAIPGLFLGCFIANLISGAIIWDVIFGSIATLIGALSGYLLRFNRWLVPIPAIISNSFIIPLVLKYGYGMTEVPYFIMVLYIALGEIIGCYILGEIFASVLIRYKKVLFNKK